MENWAEDQNVALAENLEKKVEKVAGKDFSNLKKLKQTFDKIREKFGEYLAKISGVVDDFGQTLADYVITKSTKRIPSYLVCGDGLFRIFYYDLHAERYKARIVKKAGVLGQEYELSEAISFRKRTDFLMFLNGTCKIDTLTADTEEKPSKKGYNWIVECLGYPVNA
ncbi:hypothetical protein, partial [Helicobacter bizzozeronii]|uniref:hypothetical protein n=1 Tax=Helicobacter bizzozeronii TaxID=56877 RepID=UPI00255752E9